MDSLKAVSNGLALGKSENRPGRSPRLGHGNSAHGTRFDIVNAVGAELHRMASLRRTFARQSLRAC